MKRAVLVMILLVGAAGLGTVPAPSASAAGPKASPTPATACVPAANKLEFTQAQADLVMGQYCKNTTPDNIALMTGISKDNVIRLACANRAQWPAGTQQVTCP